MTDSPTIVSRKFVEKEIDFGDTEPRKLKFYPVRLLKLLSLKAIMRDIAKGINQLMIDSKLYAGYEQEQSGEEGVSFKSMTKVEGLTEKMASRLEERKDEGLQTLLELITDKEKQIAIVGLISDSLRDVAQEFSPTNLLETDAYVFVQLAAGVAETNMAIFRPIQGALKTLMPQSEGEKTKDESLETEQPEN